MEHIIRFDGQLFVCRYFTYVFEDGDGVEVSILEGERFIGIINDIRIPDKKDLDNVNEFEATVSEWLKTKDVNYTLGK